MSLKGYQKNPVNSLAKASAHFEKLLKSLNNMRSENPLKTAGIRFGIMFSVAIEIARSGSSEEMERITRKLFDQLIDITNISHKKIASMEEQAESAASI